VISIEGDLNEEAADELRKIVSERMAQRAVARFVIDLEKCPFIDSQGLEALLRVKSLCEESLGSLRLAAPDDNIRKILEITRLEARLETHADLPSALKNLR